MNKKETKEIVIKCLKQLNDKYSKLGKTLAKDLAQRLHDYTTWMKQKEKKLKKL